MDTRSELQATIAKIIEPGKGILAADESMPTITKRFEAVGIESTESSRRAHRSLLCATPGAGQSLGRVTLFGEALGKKAEAGTPFAQWLAKLGILPGIKVDKG